MDIKYSLLVLLLIAYTVDGGRRSRPGNRILRGYGRRPVQTCSNSGECIDRRRPCCVDSSGSLLDPNLGSQGFISDPNRTGRCSRRRSRPDATCNDSCGCVRGYVCYSTVTGVCCPSKTCWAKADAQRDRDFWKNCFSNPDCRLPPTINGPINL